MSACFCLLSGRYLPRTLLLLAAVLSANPVRAQTNRSGPGFPGHIGGFPNDPFPHRIPGIPPIQGPRFETVWRCSHCGQIVARGNGSMPPARCPFCGVQLMNGFGPSSVGGGAGPNPGGSSPPAPQYSTGYNNPPPNNPPSAAPPPLPQSSATAPPQPYNTAPLPAPAPATTPAPALNPTPQPTSSDTPTAPSGSEVGNSSGMGKKILAGGIAVVALGMLVGSVVVFTSGGKSGSRTRKRKRRYDDD